MTRIFTHSLTHPENQQVGQCSERCLKSDWKDTGHGIHPAGDASEHVSLVREVLLCGYCNAAGEEERDREDETGPLTSSPEYVHATVCVFHLGNNSGTSLQRNP